MSIFADRNIIEIMLNDGQRKNIKNGEASHKQDFLLRSYYIDMFILILLRTYVGGFQLFSHFTVNLGSELGYCHHTAFLRALLAHTDSSIGSFSPTMTI